MIKRRKYNYLKKRWAKGSFKTLASTGVSVISFLTSIYLSAKHGGDGPLHVGAFAFTSFVFSVWGIYFMILAMEDDKSNTWPAKISGAIAALMLVMWIIVLALGIKTLI